MNDHLGDDLSLLVMLDPSDPERRAAEAHARECGPCSRRWRDATDALGMLDLAAPLPAPSSVVMQSVEARILTEMPAPSVASWGGAAVVLGLAALVAATARYRSHDRMDWLAFGLVLAISVLCSQRVSGGSRARVALVLATSLGLVALTARAPTDMLAPLLGLKCIAVELVAAALPLAFTAYAARRFGLPVPSLAGATVAVAGALAGQAALHVTCKAHGAPLHEAVFHFGTVVATVLLGAACAGPISRWAGRSAVK